MHQRLAAPEDPEDPAPLVISVFKEMHEECFVAAQTPKLLFAKLGLKLLSIGLEKRPTGSDMGQNKRNENKKEELEDLKENRKYEYSA